MEESKGCSEKEEEEEEEEDHFMVRDERFSQKDAAPINFNGNIDLTDLSLGNKDMDAAAAFIHGGGGGGGGGGGSCSTSAVGVSACSSSGHESIEKEHMFDKVVTPSDVGKLNRLVIPKQHAEKYFPLDSSSNEKGLLLNFEDRNGKSWRFRYSYWNSSQSYVMTKGWSRFVKEKKLDAGDIVSFQRGVSDLHKHRLYIDWRRRPAHHHHHHHASENQTTGLISPLLIPNQTPLPQYSIRWSGRLYSLPQPLSMARQHHEHMQQQMNYNFHPYYHHHQQQQHLNRHRDHFYGSSHHQHLNEVYFSSPASTSLQNQAVRQDGGGAPMVIDSVPVGHHSGKAAAKKLRLFGVNMEYSPSPDEEPRSCHILSSTMNATMATNSVLPPHLSSSSSSLSSLQLRLPHGAAMPSYSQARFQDKEESSLPLD